jgi:hypothetical protein
MEGQIRRIEEDSGHRHVVGHAVKNLRRLIRTKRPGFNDYLEGALSAVSLSKEIKKAWRLFFRALSIVRNKASHSDPSLTEAEREILRQGGFNAMVSDTGELKMNTRMYQQVAALILDFFDVLCNEANVIQPRPT